MIVVAQRASSPALPIVNPPPWKLTRRGCFPEVDVGEVRLVYEGGV